MRAAPAASASATSSSVGGREVARQRELDRTGVPPGRLRPPHASGRPARPAPRRPGPAAGTRLRAGRPGGPQPRCGRRCGWARRRAATGLGKEWAWRNETNSPSKSAPAGPESAHRVRMAAMVSSVRRPAAPGIGAGGPQLLVHPAHPHAHPDPAPGEDVHGGDALGQHHGLVVGEDQHPGGQGDPLGHRGQVGHEVERVGDPAVVGQGHPARRRVGVGARRSPRSTTACSTSTTDSKPHTSAWRANDGHPGRVGGDPGADRRDDSELHDLLTFARRRERPAPGRPEAPFGPPERKRGPGPCQYADGARHPRPEAPSLGGRVTIETQGAHGPSATWRAPSVSTPS